MGKKPHSLNFPRDRTTPSLPAPPIGIRSALLYRRPDIANAERLLATVSRGGNLAVTGRIAR
jgi:outer membrane protein TolC